MSGARATPAGQPQRRQHVTPWLANARSNFVVPSLSLGGELRHQRWLDAPFAVEGDPTGASRDTTTFAVGPRFHVEVGDVGWLRPGVSYQRALDRPLAAAAPNYHIIQVDVPFVFK